MTAGADPSEAPSLDVLFVPPWRWHSCPQVGLGLSLTWDELARWLSRPTIGVAKEQAGAWSPALYEGNVRRKSALVHAAALVLDVDDRGDVDAVAEVVARYRATVHETFSSTPKAPRCRIVLELMQAVDAATYERVHKIVRAHLADAGVLADEGAKDASRLSFAPVRRAGDGYRFRTLDGRPLDAQACISAQPPEPPRSAPQLPSAENRDSYIRGALRRAADAVSSASEGVRHYTLSREAFALARFGLSDTEIAATLLPAFVTAAGERRQWEGARTIRDAIRARRGSA
jgi:hypothetical protein